MKKCILFHNQVTFNKSHQFIEYNKLNFYEYLYFLYNTFKLENHDTETIIPCCHKEDVRLIVTKNDDLNNEEDQINKYLSSSNIVTLESLIDRVIKKSDGNEAINENIISQCVFILNSLDLSQSERVFVNFLLKLNHAGVYYECKDELVLLTVAIEPMTVQPSSLVKISGENDVAKLLISYLSVAINVRDQLRFSYIFNVPDRRLTHHAFTSLRHEAEQKHLSMPQVALSFVTQLKLGGHSYAPASDYVLNKYIFGLSQLVAVINSLYSVMEDHCGDEDKVGIVGRMLRVVQKCLLGDKTGRFNKKHIDAVRERMVRNMRQLCDQDKSITVGDKTAPLKAIVRLIRRLIGHYATCYDEYMDCVPANMLVSPSVLRTPTGGCSKDIALLYSSPCTLDSPMATKKKMSDNSNSSCSVGGRGESMPSWPLHCKYQSHLSWTSNDMTPPHIVRQQTERSRHNIVPLVFDDDAIDEEIFANLIIRKDEQHIPRQELTTNEEDLMEDNDNVSKRTETTVKSKVETKTVKKVLKENNENVIKSKQMNTKSKQETIVPKKVLKENNGRVVKSKEPTVTSTKETKLPKKRPSVTNECQNNVKKSKLVPGQKLITSFFMN